MLRAWTSLKDQLLKEGVMPLPVDTWKLIHQETDREVFVCKDEAGKKNVQKAVSHLRILKTSTDFSYVELNPITGRKHQLRKQLYNIGNPIIGDDKYFINKRADKIKLKSKRLLLHAYKIRFMINNIQYNFKAEYDKEFENFLKKNF